MSTFLKKMKHPVSKVEVVAVCHDDHFGNHVYGYGFKKDGTDFTIEDFGKFEDLDFFRGEDLLEPLLD